MNKLIALTLISLTACASTSSKLDEKKSERNLATEYAKDLLATKFKIFENPDCRVWEDKGEGNLQSVYCTIGDVIGLYCRAGEGKAPTCEFNVDKRPKEEPKKDAPAKEAPKK